MNDAALLDAFTQLLRPLVEIESPTGDVEANLRIASGLEALLTDRGAKVERVDAPGYGQHLVARVGPSPEVAPLLLLGHMDTVHPVGSLATMPLQVSDERISGPGVFDMKGGLCLALSALDLVRARDAAGSGPGLAPGGLTILITCDEEVGSPTSRDLIEREARASRATLVFEPSLPGGTVKVARKGVADYRVAVRGVPAHAGIEPEKGANAIHTLLQLLAEPLAAAKPDQGTTVNVGRIAGGTALNVVAEHAEAGVDVRFWTRDEADRLDRVIKNLVSTAPGVDPRVRVEVTGGVNRYPLEQTEASRDLLERAEAEASDLGWAVGTGRTGGGSDGNFTSAVGCPTLDGLGVDGGGAHAQHEHLLLAGLPGRIRWIARLLEVL